MPEEQARDVGLTEAIASYVSDVFPHQPDERNVMPEVTDPAAEIPIDPSDER